MTSAHGHFLTAAAVGVMGALAVLAESHAPTRAPEAVDEGSREAIWRPPSAGVTSDDRDLGGDAGGDVAGDVGTGEVGDARTAGAWSAGAPIPVRIAEIAGAAIGRSIYVGGGFTPPGGSIGRWFGRYDTTDDAWEALAELPTAVHHPMMAAAKGRIWSAGGYTAGLNRAAATRRLDVYDPTTSAWTAMADMPGRRAAGFMVAVGGGGNDTVGGVGDDAVDAAGRVGVDGVDDASAAGALYVVGGIGDAEDRMWRYDIAAGTWADLPGPTPREHLGAAASGGKVYVVAGRGFGRGIVGMLEAYDPATGAWTRLTDMPGACGGCTAAATADGRIHVTGGEGGGRTYDDHYVYDPATGAWSVEAPMPTARHGIASAGVGERFYVIGGGLKEGLDYSTVVEWWGPGGGGTATAGATGTAGTAVGTAVGTATGIATPTVEPTSVATAGAGRAALPFLLNVDM